MSSSDRTPWKTATAIDQALLDACADNLSINLDLVVDIEAPDGSFIRASNINKYKGETFYEARCNFPVISRTVGQWLSPELEFSTLTLELNNADGRFNRFLPSGADYGGWIGRSVVVSLGLSDVASSYRAIYRGKVTDVGGFERSTFSITFVTRDDFDRINVNFPQTAITKAGFPDVEDGIVGQIVPIIYGDWTVDVGDYSIVPSYVVNGDLPGVKDDETVPGTGGTEPVWLLISENDLALFDTSSVFLFRGSQYWPVDPADVFDVSAGNRMFKLRQKNTSTPGVTLVDGLPYIYGQSDQFVVKVKGKDLGAASNNAVAQGKDLLKAFGGMVDADFDANWATYAAKATPAKSAIASIKSRIWVADPQPVLTYVLSLLEQVRLEAFISRDLKLKILSNQPEDWSASPTFSIRNWDVEKDSFKPKLSETVNFNRVQGVYSFNPTTGEQSRQTAVFKNQAAITQAGKAISKKIVYPNLHVESQVIDQLSETLKLASGYGEFVPMTLTWRSLLLDVGDFVKINVRIGATEFVNVPAMVRELGYDPDGMKVPVTVWSFQMVPFPGWAPGYAGIVGGDSAIIVQE